jgi:uncharacterized protein (DUF433 family)
MQLPEFLNEDGSGSIRVSEHRISLEHFVHFYNQGYSAEMLLGQFPTLSLPLIHKVIAFYLENQAAVDTYVSSFQSDVDRHRAASPVFPDLQELRRRAATLTKTHTP